MSFTQSVLDTTPNNPPMSAPFSGWLDVKRYVGQIAAQRSISYFTNRNIVKLKLDREGTDNLANQASESPVEIEMAIEIEI
jgi:hypothetical protein